MIACPSCGGTRWAVPSALYRLRAAPWWVLLFSLGMVRAVRVRIGYAGECVKCHRRWMIDAAANEVWEHGSKREALEPLPSAEKPVTRVPAGGGLAFRTEEAWRKR